MKLLHTLYHFECHVFKKINRYFENKILNFFFRNITHFGSTVFTIVFVILLFLLTEREGQLTAVASALALAASQIPVQLFKRFYPRKRPYLTLDEARFPFNPLKDHSFPSGHTTAVFSVLTPIALFLPIIAPGLFILGAIVGISRIYLGLHYPSDVLAGGTLGSLTGASSYFLLF